MRTTPKAVLAVLCAASVGLAACGGGNSSSSSTTGSSSQKPAGSIDVWIMDPGSPAVQKVVKGLSGTLTLLRDDGFSDEEMLEWLFTPDESLPGTPAQALSENRGTEVKRRAQALAV